MGADGFHFGVRPITLAINSWEIPEDKLGEVLKRAVRRGYVGSSPQIVKTLDGEFLVYANNTVQFVPLGRAPGPQIPI